MKTQLLFLITSLLILVGCAKEPEPYVYIPSVNPDQNIAKATALIDGSNRRQAIDGFGFSTAWCGKLSAVKNDALYGTLGFSLLRIRIDQNRNYWGDETANSAAAHAVGVKVLGSEWSPPVDWNSNGQSVGGYLLPEHYGDYANYLKDAANTIKLDYVSFQNEPDMGYVDPKGVVSWTADQMFYFLKNYSATIGKPIVYAESFNFNDAYTDPALNDTSTVNKFAIVGGHIYGNGLRVHQNAINKGKHVWQTEHYVDKSRDDFSKCLILAKEITDCMINEMNAYFFWWVYDPDASVNLVNNSGLIYKSGYTGGQFAKWIRPGMTRIGCTYNPISNVYLTAYTGNGTVIVAVNMGTVPVSQTFTLSNLSGISAMNVNRTNASDNMSFMGTVYPTNNSFTFTLGAQSVTTFHQN